METQTRLVHWYHIESRRIACGAPGQSGSTKHASGVTCAACLALLAKAPARAEPVSAPLSYLH